MYLLSLKSKLSSNVDGHREIISINYPDRQGRGKQRLLHAGEGCELRGEHRQFCLKCELAKDGASVPWGTDLEQPSLPF